MTEAITRLVFEIVILPLAAVLLGQAVMALKLFISTKKDLLNEQSRQRLNEAIDNASKLAMEELGKVDIGKVVSYTRALNPGDLKKFGLDKIANENKLRLKIEGRVAQVTKK